MATIFLVRHQAAGYVHEYPFASTPTDIQLEAVRKFCFNRCGFSHKKTPDVPYWMRVEEVELLGPNDVPDVPDRELSAVSLPSGHAVTASKEFGAHGTGHVTQKGGE